MTTRRRTRVARTAGRPGTFVRVGPEWIGWTDRVTHPDARAGGGGPGHFTRMPLGPADESDLPTPWRDAPTRAAPLDAPAPKPANLPPATTPRSLGVVKEVQTDLIDYRIDAEVVTDGSGGTSGALTEFSKPASRAPGYAAENGRITKFDGKFTFRGTVQIKTSYAPDATPKTLSCYGRGTTAVDVSCHHADYEAYLKAHALPDPPAMTIGMKAADYDAAVAAFVKAVNGYWAAMQADSVRKTDEVGFTLSKSNSTNSCYVHELP
jgi:hypothetical protein